MQVRVLDSQPDKDGGRGLVDPPRSLQTTNRKLYLDTYVLDTGEVMCIIYYGLSWYNASLRYTAVDVHCRL